jgi:type IV pilus assembly protein PilO
MAKNFNDLSSRTQIVVFGVLCLLVVVAGWQLAIGPAREDLTTREAKLTTLQGDVARAQATASKLPAFERDVKALEASLSLTTAILPDEKDPQDVLRNLHELASDASLDISSFTPKSIATKTQYSEWPIELGLAGGYHDLGRFFDRVATMSRLVSISDLHIKTNIKPATKGTITATCVATTFVFKKDIAPGATSPVPVVPAAAALAGGVK